MRRRNSSTRYSLSEEIKTNAPLLAALDKYNDATGQFAGWLENKKLLRVFSRYGKNNYPCYFYCDTSKFDWTALEKEFLIETMQYQKAKNYSEGKKLPFEFSFGGLVFELLKFTPVIIIIWLLKK
jgi:hypothetical protein